MSDKADAQPPNAQPPAPSTVDPQQIAALIDGRLSDAEREAILAKLDRSDEALEILSDAAAALGDLQATTPSAPIEGRLSNPSRRATGVDARRTRRWFGAAGLATAGLATAGLATAAAIAAVIAWPHIASHSTGQQLDDPARFTVGLDLSAPSIRETVAATHPWSEVRGDVSASRSSGQAARVGAYIVDLELAERSATTEEARQAATRALDALISTLQTTPGGTSAAHLYQALRDQPSAPTAAQRLRPRIAAAAIDPDLVALGSWAEAARYAAAAHDARFFASDATRALLGAAQRSARVPAAAQASIGRLAAPPPTTESDWRALQEQVAALLRLLAT